MGHAHPEEHDLDVLDHGDLADEGIEPGEGDEDEGDRPARLGFRGIPTWQEAIGLIVDKNLELRAKRSAGGSHSGRGHRGPRDNRGQGGRRRPS